MRVVADSHVLYFYLFSRERLSERALEVLGESEDSDGIVVSVVSLADLWYVDHKAGGSPFPPGRSRACGTRCSTQPRTST